MISKYIMDVLKKMSNGQVPGEFVQACLRTDFVKRLEDEEVWSIESEFAFVDTHLDEYCELHLLFMWEMRVRNLIYEDDEDY